MLEIKWKMKLLMIFISFIKLLAFSRNRTLTCPKGMAQFRMNTNNTPFIHLINIHQGIWCVGLSNKGKKQNVCALVIPQDTTVRVAEQNSSNVDKAHFQKRLKKKN